MQEYLEDDNQPVLSDLFTIGDLDYLSMSRKVELFLVNPDKFMNLVTYIFHQDYIVFELLYKNIQKGLRGDALFSDKAFIQQLSVEQLFEFNEFVNLDFECKVIFL